MRARILTFLLLSLASCQRCRGDAQKDAGTKESLAVEMPEKIAPIAWTDLDSTRGFGLPPGCRLDGPARRAKIGAERVRFLSARTDLARLAVATAEAKSAVKSAGFVAPDAGVAPVPWGELEAPPILERSSSGWVGVWSHTTESSRVRAVFWREGERAETLAEGDSLGVADAMCIGDRCAILTSIPRAAAVPGASLHIGSSRDPAGAYRRVDLEPSHDEAWQPLAIAGVEQSGRWWAAVASPTHTAIFAESKLEHRLDTQFGAWDAALAPGPLVVAPGASTEDKCITEGFPIAIVRPDGKRSELRTPAAPESVVLRPIGAGAFLGWVAPVSCNDTERRFVYSALVKSDGTIAAGPMAVAEASGFALATEGDSLSLWLLSGSEISWLRARCEIKP